MINSAILMGRLTADTELKTTQSNKSVISFTIAVDRKYQQNTTDFIRCVAWERTADFINKFFKKGSLIAVEGELQTRSYEVDGEKRSVTEVVVNNASFTGEKANTQDDGPQDDDFTVLPNGLPF